MRTLDYRFCVERNEADWHSLTNMAANWSHNLSGWLCLEFHIIVVVVGAHLTCRTIQSPCTWSYWLTRFVLATVKDELNIIFDDNDPVDLQKKAEKKNTTRHKLSKVVNAPNTLFKARWWCGSPAVDGFVLKNVNWTTQQNNNKSIGRQSCLQWLNRAQRGHHTF